MTLDQLMAKVNKLHNFACDDRGDFVLMYHREPKGSHGDTLAKFIVTEVTETFDAEASDADQVAEVRRVILRAAGDLAIIGTRLKP